MSGFGALGHVGRHDGLSLWSVCLSFYVLQLTHEVRRAGVLTCASCHLERSADHIRTVADPVKFRKLLKSHYFRQAFNIC